MPDKAVDLKITLSALQRLVLGKNPSRIYCLLVSDGAGPVYLGMGIPATATRGIPLLTAGSNYEITLMNPWHGEIYAVGDASTPVLTIVEW